ncbi:MAG: hypothetical protein GC160_21110 [Acidobacteria bacterium]|nr:hypothetical protein [Acidobacteriota bacterium]
MEPPSGKAARPKPYATIERMRRLLAVAWCFCALAFGQSQRVSGGLEVTVVDLAGSPVVGAVVSLETPEGGLRRTAQSGPDGRALLSAVPSGEYELRVEQEGFAPQEIDDVEVSLSRTTRLRVTLRLEAVQETVEVTASAGTVDTAAVTSSASLGSERIEEGPSANRNYLNFVLVAPGVAQSAGSNARKSLAGTRAPLSDSGFTFGGMRGRNNSLSVDGVDNRDETTGGQRVSIGLELVQEFRVAGAMGGAEHGGAAGGSVDVVTRSGTNIWHGDMTWFFQDSGLNARDPEVDVGRKPRTRKYQPGVSLLGPARRDKTFFAFALEQVSERGEEWSDTPAVSVQAVNQALASPRFAGAAVHQVSRGLFAADSSETELAFKLDHHVNQQSFLAARYAFSRGRMANEVHGLDNFSDNSARGSSLTRDHALTAAFTSSPRANLFYDLRTQFARRDVGLSPNSRGALLEIPGVVSLGQAFRLDSQRTEDHWEAVGSLGFATVKHTLGFGGSMQYIPLQARFDDRTAGIFVFPTLQAFSAGLPDLFVQRFSPAATRLSTTPGGLWVEDRWRPGRGVTLSAGLRWDAQRLPAGFRSPKANFAPRLSAAWTPADSLVLRAGMGWFFDRYPLAFLKEAGWTEQILAGTAAQRAFGLGLGAGLGAPVPGEQLSTYQADPDFPTTYSRKISVGAEQGLSDSTKLSVEYSAVRGFHLPRIRNANGGLPALNLLEQTARSSYHGFSASLERKMTREMTFLVAYQAGRTRDDGSDFDERPLDPLDIRKDWALSRQHQGQRLAASGLFELFEDVVLSPILTVGTPRPLNTLLTTDAYRTGAYPLSARPEGVARNTARAAGVFSLDLRVMKGFWVMDDRAILQVGVEAFNLLNHTNVLRANPFDTPSHGARLETLNPRQLQLMAQFEF